jgi:hypothetical protein
VRVADRRSVFGVGLACAVGWQYRMWPLPVLAFALLERGSASAARRIHRLPAAVRRHVARDPGDGATRPFDQAA